ncbi:MAG: 4Fe-4S binding protein [Eggerthellales bacterium]|nr:4Fe-4S binding protein [Eggerthellales bacterium]
MNIQKLRALIPVLVIVVIAVGFGLNSGVGTLSAVGWGDISLLCPLGALSTMLASKMLVPRALVSLVLAIIAILILGRAFCAWICPVPFVGNLRDAFTPKSKRTDAAGTSKAAASSAKPSIVEANDAAADSSVTATVATTAVTTSAARDASAAITLSAEELASLKSCSGGCSSCSSKRETIDTRHFVLGGALLSAAIFGFPVFCLICPIGLTFATVLLVMLLFGGGDVTWSVVLVPLLLLAEVVFFRKWCSKICPLSAFMSLVAKGNKTFKPTVDPSKCLESTKGVSCGKCSQVCHVGINPRHPDLGAAASECSKCRACVDNCPGHAISMPFLPKKQAPQAQFNQVIQLNAKPVTDVAAAEAAADVAACEAAQETK